MLNFSPKFIVLLLVYIQFTLLILISLTPNNLDDPNTPDSTSFKLVFLLPSLIVPFFSGFIIDYIGVSNVLVCCTIIGIIGQSFGFCFIERRSQDIYILEYLFVSRFLYGTISETICISCFCLIIYWVKSSEVGKYIGVMTTLYAGEFMLITLLSMDLFNPFKQNATKPEHNDKFYILYSSVFYSSIASFLISLFLHKVQKKGEAEDQISNKLESHPDYLISFWKSMKKSLKFEFLLVSFAFSLCSTIFFSFILKMETLLPFIFPFTQKLGSPFIYNLCIDDNYHPFEKNVDMGFQYDVHYYSCLVNIIPLGILLLSCYHVGKYCMNPKNKYLLCILGVLLTIVSFFSFLLLLANICGNEKLKTSLFVFGLIFFSLGFSLQYTILYATVGVITKERMLGVRYGIIHGLRNVLDLFNCLVVDSILSNEGKITENTDLFKVKNEIIYFLLYLVMVAGVELCLYLVIIISKSKRIWRIMNDRNQSQKDFN